MQKADGRPLLGVLFAAIRSEIEGEHALGTPRTFEDLRMAQRANGIVVSGAEVLLHARARKLVILRPAFVSPRAVDELYEIVHFAPGNRIYEIVFGRFSVL